MTAALQLTLPYVPAPTLAQLARRAQEKMAQAFARAFCPRRVVEAESRVVQVELLDPARVATEFARGHATEIAEFEERHSQPRGGLMGAVWADIIERWRKRKPLRLVTILNAALRAVAGELIRPIHRARAIIHSLTEDWGGDRDIPDVQEDDDTSDDGAERDIAAQGGDPLDVLLRDADTGIDAADAWLAEHEPQRKRQGTSERTQERERAEERTLMDAAARSAARFAASAGRIGRTDSEVPA